MADLLHHRHAQSTGRRQAALRALITVNTNDVVEVWCKFGDAGLVYGLGSSWKDADASICGPGKPLIRPRNVVAASLAI